MLFLALIWKWYTIAYNSIWKNRDWLSKDILRIYQHYVELCYFYILQTNNIILCHWPPHAECNLTCNLIQTDFESRHATLDQQIKKTLNRRFNHKPINMLKFSSVCMHNSSPYSSILFLIPLFLQIIPQLIQLFNPIVPCPEENVQLFQIPRRFAANRWIWTNGPYRAIVPQ